MEFKRFEFNPSDGFYDTGYYEDTPANPREVLQRQHDQTRDYINSVINTLNSDDEGESGSESIKSPSIAGVVGNNVFEQIKDIKRQMNDIALNSVPDGSITNLKLAEASVTGDKIQNESVGSDKFSKDAVVPKADDVININGVTSEAYYPVDRTGSMTLFKEPVSYEKLSDISGKMFNGKRYIIKDNLLCTLDLKTGEINQVSAAVLDSGMKFAVISEEDIICAKYVTSGVNNTTGSIEVYKYNIEYNNLTLMGSFEITIYSGSYYRLLDIETDGETLFIGMQRYINDATLYYYKVRLSDIGTSDSVSYVFSKDASTSTNFFFRAGNDIILGRNILRDGLAETVDTLTALPLSYDNGNLLMYSSQIFIVDCKTTNPRAATLNKLDTTNAFIYNGALYRLIENYLFKTQLFQKGDAI